MEINLNLNGRAVSASVRPDTLLLDFLRDQGCYSVKRGCETSNWHLYSAAGRQTGFVL